MYIHTYIYRYVYIHERNIYIHMYYVTAYRNVNLSSQSQSDVTWLMLVGLQALRSHVDSESEKCFFHYHRCRTVP